MKLRLSHHQKILQKLTLTPQMKQSIRLLGMSTMDLNQYVDSAVEANPFLKKELGRKRLEKYEKNIPARAADNSEDEYDYIQNIRQEDNPRLSFLSQIRMSGLKGKALEIAEYLIDEIDDNGYIAAELEDVADALSADMDEAEKALEAIQGMDPPGIGARGVRECLQLQLKRMGKEDSLEYSIVTKFINELARDDIYKISKALGADKEKVRAAVSNIKKLSPRPTVNILSKDTQRVIPDLIADVKNKELTLRMNKEWMPRLAFYNPYENEAEIAGGPEAKKFIKENTAAAKLLISNLTRREETIYKVADYILNLQRSNITEDGHELKALTIKDVAKALNMHSSTISRAVSNKYIQINNKVMPLNSLLSKGMKKQDGTDISNTAIKKNIGNLVKKENSAAPLTDEHIKKKLEEDGIKIERRTVAKYRNAMRILPAYLRKKS